MPRTFVHLFPIVAVGPSLNSRAWPPDPVGGKTGGRRYSTGQSQQGDLAGTLGDQGVGHVLELSAAPPVPRCHPTLALPGSVGNARVVV